MNILFILLRKEFTLFFKNKFLPKVAFIFPCAVILIIPLVTTMDVRHVGVTVVSRDNSPLTRRVVADLESTSFFSVAGAPTYADALERIRRGQTDVILEIPEGFQAGVDAGVPQLPHISANGVNGIKGSLGSRYVSQSVMQTLARYSGREMPQSVSVQYLFNPTLEYRNNMIPALMIMLLIMICGFLPALNLIGEKESGTIEQMNVTPVRPAVFVLSKVIPYWLIGIVDLTLAMGIAAAVYGLTPAGSLGAIYLAALLFILVISGVGIVIANFSDRMSQGMFVMFFIVMVFILMSGLLTPISSMPQWAQYATYALPPRYFIDIMRSLYLKATPPAALWPDYAALAAFAALLNALAALTYRKSAASA